MRRLTLLAFALVTAALLCWGVALCGAQPFQPVDLTHPLLRTLVGWWRAVPGFTGGDRFFDLGPLRLHGTLSGPMGYSTSSGWSATSRRGGYAQLNFDGTDDYVELGNLPAFDFVNTAFTVMGWFRQTVDGQFYVVAKRGAGGWFVRLDSGGTLTARIDGGVGSASGRTSTTTGMADGVWHHFAAVFTTSTTVAAQNSSALYVNGALDQGADIGTGDTYLAGGNSLQFGASGTAFYLTGSLDDVVLLQRSLSAGEVQAWYQASLQGYAPLAVPEALAAVPSAGNQGSGFLPFFR